MTIRGTKHDDNLVGTSGDDVFLMTQRGNDTVDGGDGNDRFRFGKFLTAADHIDGGTGDDKVILNGDYSAGLTFAADTMVNVERLQLIGNHDYALTMNDGNVAAGERLIVNASDLGAGNHLDFDGSAELDGRFLVYGGAGDDTIMGGAKADVFHLENGGSDTVRGGGGNDTFDFGAALDTADTIDGGDGNDTVAADAGTYTIGNITDVETLRLTGDSDSTITWTAPVTGTLTVDNSQAISSKLSFDGNGNAGAFHVVAGSDAALTGGDGNDTFDVFNAINYQLTGNGGDDTFNFGVWWHDAAGHFARGGTGSNTATFTGDYSGILSIDGKLNLFQYDGVHQQGIENVQTIVLNGTNTYVAVFQGDISGGQTLNVVDNITGGQITLDLRDATSAGYHLEGGTGGFNAIFSDNFSVSDQIDGGTSGLSQIQLQGDYTGANALVLADTTMTHIHNLTVFSADITTAEGTVAAGETMYVTDFGGTFDGAAETDGHFYFLNTGTWTGGDLGDVFDVQNGSWGTPTLHYTDVAQSTSVNYDQVVNFDTTQVVFDFGGAVGGFDGTVNASVDSASFDADLHAVTDGALEADHAWVVDVTGGDLSGHQFLIVDIDGNARYDAGHDYVIDVTGYTGTFVAGDFV